MPQTFKNREQAGELLARLLQSWQPQRPLILALPRGGVPVGAAIARQRAIPLDVFVVRKLGTPDHPELAMGALASGGTVVWNPKVLRAHQLSDKLTLPILDKARRKLEEEEKAYRRLRPQVPVKGRDILLVDDGLATGSTMKAAVLALRDLDAGSLTVAVPVSSPEAEKEISPLVKSLMRLECPDAFSSVGEWYEDFRPVSASEIESILADLGG